MKKLKDCLGCKWFNQAYVNEEEKNEEGYCELLAEEIQYILVCEED